MQVGTEPSWMYNESSQATSSAPKSRNLSIINVLMYIHVYSELRWRYNNYNKWYMKLYIISSLNTVKLEYFNWYANIYKYRNETSNSIKTEGLCELFIWNFVRWCCTLFTFLSSSPEPLGHFQPHLAQGIIAWRGFELVQMIKGR